MWSLKLRTVDNQKDLQLGLTVLSRYVEGASLHSSNCLAIAQSADLLLKQFCCWQFFCLLLQCQMPGIYGTSAMGVAEHQTIVGCLASCIEFCKHLNSGLGCTLLKAILWIVAAAGQALCAFHKLR